MCQDTGMTVVFVEMGQEIRIIGGYLERAINEGVRRGYQNGYLRKYTNYKDLKLFVFDSLKSNLS